MRVSCKCGWRLEAQNVSEPELRDAIKALESAANRHEAVTIRQSHKHETTEVFNLG